MAKSASKKKASSARRKVQASTVHSRKDVKRGELGAGAKKTEAKKTDAAKKVEVTKKAETTKKTSTTKKVEVVEKVETAKKAAYQQAVDEKLAEKKAKKIEIKEEAAEPSKKTVKTEEKVDTPKKTIKVEEKVDEPAKAETKVEVKAEEKTEPSKIILHGDERMHPLAQEVAKAAEQHVSPKKEPMHEASTLVRELKSDEKNVEEVLQEVIERQEEVAQQDVDHKPAPEPTHPVVVAPEHQTAVKVRPTAKQQKEAAIEKAIAETKAAPMPKRQKSRQRVHFGFRRVILAMACAAAAVFAIVYFVHQSTPNISLKVAAMQSGIDARYPSYVPRDFSLSDITSENGKITLNFRNSATSEAFTIVEEKSAWDSNALLANYVRDAYGDDYSQVAEQGLTIFISGNDACWVNGGVVYKLKTTSGSLTKKQIKAIAVSL